MELRPTLTSPDVLLAYAADLLERVKTLYGDLHVVDDQRALKDLCDVVQAADDGFNRGMMLVSEGWVVNQDLVAILDPRNANLHVKAWDRQVEAWVIRTGMRFPAPEGGRVNFKNNSTGFTLVGDVRAVLQKRAMAYVAIAGGDEPYRVNAEDVTAIITNGIATPIQTVLALQERLTRAAAQRAAMEAEAAAA